MFLKRLCKILLKPLQWFIILVGAALFSLVFRGYGGDEIVAHFLTNIEGGVVTSIIITMLFLFSFFLEVLR